MLHQNAPIVLVHGLFGNLQDKRILSAFGGRSVHAPELIGYGEYRQVDVSGLALNDQADHVVRYINNLDVEKFISLATLLAVPYLLLCAN
ncbi:hypothetical protein BQ8482_130048 [Mesorhizobium delmotii]|uniref:Uncharacterized protein n=1 Tax=Mesorhizobium delmotii TaxID=1631247 RepID=A0A2P9AGA3_9HYPH|nr:hypothetical protein BQ8482_130048 [Mesorhizobium delmotii]